MDTPWWQAAVFYQIYPRSFASGHGGPVGDLEGIEKHLDHITWLGVDAVWLSPFYPSPMADFGYDVSDFCDVDPRFGDLGAFDRLLTACHDRGLKLLIDYVPNHSSDQHPWFQQARSSRDDPKRSWYVWRDGVPDRPPNNWRAAFARDAPAWTWDEATGQWYLHMFLPQQPDLNWENPEVVEAMHGVMRFWLDRGVDGFRIDVVHGLGKEPGLPDDPPESGGLPHATLNDTAETHELIRGLRRVADAYPGDRLLLGEVYLLSTEQVATYYGAGDELHLAFNFPPLYTPWEARRWRRAVDRTVAHVDGRDGWATWVLSNHDNVRHRGRYGGSEDRARAALFLLLGLRGSPVLYAGEELGLEDAVVPPERRVDPGGRDGCRAPLPWTAEPDHGWGTTDPWLPWTPNPERTNVASLRADETSILYLYRRLLAARRASPGLVSGDFAWLDAPDDVLAWRRRSDGDERVVAVNMGSAPARLDVTGRVVVASDGRGEGEPFGGRLAGDQAVVIEPG
jgi:alpha-glucosidase